MTVRLLFTQNAGCNVDGVLLAVCIGLVVVLKLLQMTAPTPPNTRQRAVKVVQDPKAQ